MNSPSRNPNLELLQAAARRLAPLLDRIVFVGGCAAGLLITDPGSAPVRPTRDVDGIVAVASYDELIALENTLRQSGFWQPTAASTPVCRWAHVDVIFDLMPIDPSILGFSNRWYRPAFENSESVQIGEQTIRLISGPYFLATKLEAFRERGKNDYRTSRDLEDIVTVLDGRAEIITEVRSQTGELKQYLVDPFAALLENSDFIEAVPGYLLPDPTSQQRMQVVIDRMRQIAARSDEWR